MIKIVVGAILAAGLGLSAAEAASPTVRHFTTAIVNGPERLPALPDAPSVHYEPGARAQARRVAAILPAALSRVAIAQGRPFAHPVIVGVYASPDAFAAANGVGTPDVGGVTFMGRVTLSPLLFAKPTTPRLEAILTHELSHAHLAGWMSVLATVSLPNWFKEGLAVMVSHGGGAEGVSDAEARDAIRRGDRIAITESGSLLHLTTVEFEQTSKIPETSIRVRLAYREAALFVRYLRDRDPAAFTHLMHDIEENRPFRDAVRTAYGVNVVDLWSRFVAG